MNPDAAEIKARLNRHLSLPEAAALTTAIAFGIWMIVLDSHTPLPGLLFDFRSHTSAARGDIHGYFYGLWGIVLLSPFASLPFTLGILAWQLTNISGFFIASRVFGGKTTALLVSYQMMVCLYFGQITGILCLGIALMWLGLAKRNWLMAGLGLTIAAIKPQVGIIAGLVWLYAHSQDFASHKNFPAKLCIQWKSLILPAAAAAASFIIQPGWVAQTLERIRTIPPNATASVTAWNTIGAWGLLALLPPLVLPLERRARLLALIAGWMAFAPYMQPYDMAALFMFPLGWLPLLSWVAVPLGLPNPPLPLFFLLILVGVYGWQIWPGVRQMADWRKKRIEVTGNQ